MWRVNEDGISITDPNGQVYVAGDEITRPDGTIIMVKSDWQGITNEDLRKYVPDARSWNGVICASLNMQGEKGDPGPPGPSVETAFIKDENTQYKWRYEGASTENLSMNGAKIISLGNPTADNDAASKFYVDRFPLKTINGQTIRGEGNINIEGGGGSSPFEVDDTGNFFTQRAFTQVSVGGGNSFFVTARDIDPDDFPNAVVNKKYVDDAVANVGGDNLWHLVPSGADDMILQPVNLSNDVQIGILRVTGMIATSGISAGADSSVLGNITITGEPTDDEHVATKKYVDDQVSNLRSLITTIQESLYRHYQTYTVNSNNRWTFTDFDPTYWYHFYMTVRLTGERFVTGMLEVPTGIGTTNEAANVISDTTSGSSNNLRFRNGQVWVDNWQGDPIYVTTIAVYRKKDFNPTAIHVKVN